MEYGDVQASMEKGVSKEPPQSYSLMQASYDLDWSGTSLAAMWPSKAHEVAQMHKTSSSPQSPLLAMLICFNQWFWMHVHILSLLTIRPSVPDKLPARKEAL